MSQFKLKEKEKDERIVKNIGNWEITCSPSKKCLYIDTTSYHTFKLKLTKKDLQDLINILDKEVQKGINREH